jgi:hypothetical protein
MKNPEFVKLITKKQSQQALILPLNRVGEPPFIVTRAREATVKSHKPKMQ